MDERQKNPNMDNKLGTMTVDQLRDRRATVEREWEACKRSNREEFERMSARYGIGFLRVWEREDNLKLKSFLVAQTKFKEIMERRNAEIATIDRLLLLLLQGKQNLK